MLQYLFQLGHQPHISTAEIKAVFSQQKTKYQIVLENTDCLLVEVKEEIDPIKLINRLGGTVKISEMIEQNLTEADKTIDTLVNFLNKKQTTGKINFSVSGKDAQKTALKIKKELKNLDRSVRYIEIKNTATILHNKLVEKEGDFTITNNSIFVTRAIQPFEEFGLRDYGRPDSDSESGMLPPKLARILINLSRVIIGETILDPFCGSGTILMEAAHLGHVNFIGSDISKKAILDTGRNLEWLKINFDLPHLPYQTLNINATELTKHLDKKSIDTIITEPYLGKPLKGKETKAIIDDQTKELKKLYIEAFSEFYKILKSSGSIIFIIPRFRYQNSWITIDCIDEIKKTGFKPEPFSPKEPCLLYWRPGQHLGREIWKFNLSS